MNSVHAAAQRILAALAFGMFALLAVSSGAPAQAALPLPFGIGERLTYTGHTELLGEMGRGEMWIEGPVDVRGISAWVLRFDFSAGLPILGASDKSSSWIDATRMTSLRFEKHSRRFLSGNRDRVEIFPDGARWTRSKDSSGKSLSNLPLDELSFIYFIRTLPLILDSTYVLDRHFEATRNPTLVRVMGRQTINTKAGTFQTLQVEMIVKDAVNYDKEGTIRFLISDDARRLPVRIESKMPGVGMATLTLESHTPAVDTRGGATPRPDTTRRYSPTAIQG
jgi:hypothetical protein